jgi:2-dehydro-3-deoxyphosphogluconate aldolase/(4S)-4-hydroxy-2-oxoglutarate aldolase
VTAPLLSGFPVVPVVVIETAEQALPLGRALLAGGIAVMEVTLRTEAGLEGIRRLTGSAGPAGPAGPAGSGGSAGSAAETAEAGLDGMTVGAGSVLTPDQVDQVVGAGAKFVVSPGVNAGVVRRAQELGVPSLPGVSNSSDLMTATQLGLREVKFFPAGLLGGPAMIRALSAPFGQMRFMPSGGVTPANLPDYLALPCVPAVSGSWMVEQSLVSSGDWDEVTRLATEAVTAAREALAVRAAGV